MQENKEIVYRWVFGTKDQKWHQVDSSDRDYAVGITTSELEQIGPKKAAEKYLLARRMK